jgi:hypothetical protein
MARVINSYLDAVGKGKPISREVTLHQLLEPRLINQHLSASQHFNFSLVIIDTDHLMTYLRETAPVTGPTYPDPTMAIFIW